MKPAIIVLILLSLYSPAQAAGDYTNDQIADSIFRAEGGAKTSHPYGILKHYKTTTPRQACINTIKSARKRFAAQSKETDFIHFLSLTYCPTQGKHLTNDEKRLNVNWERNVKYYLEAI